MVGNELSCSIPLGWLESIENIKYILDMLEHEIFW